jgi:uncharacterized damage-inducible protein DinB
MRPIADPSPSLAARVLAFALAASVIAIPARLVAQDVPSRADAVEIRMRFMNDLDTLQSKFLALAEAIPAEKYAWRPSEGVRSVGEAFMHVASEYYVYTPMAYGAARSTVIPQGRGELQKFETMSSKPEVLKHLKESFAFMKANVDALDPAKLTGSQKLFGSDRTIIETSFIMSGDLHEHLGQLIAYARANGVKPPWSK